MNRPPNPFVEAKERGIVTTSIDETIRAWDMGFDARNKQLAGQAETLKITIAGLVFQYGNDKILIPQQVTAGDTAKRILALIGVTIQQIF